MVLLIISATLIANEKLSDKKEEHQLGWFITSLLGVITFSLNSL